MPAIAAKPAARPERPAWRRTLWVMVAVQVLMMMGFTVSNTIVPLFLEYDLGLAPGRQLELWSGAVAAASFLTLALFSPVWGNLADRHGRKVMVLRSTAAIGVFSLLTAIVRSPFQMFLLKLGMGCLSGFAASAVALVASVAPKEELGYALGMLSSGQIVGAVFGPLLGGVISTVTSYRVAFTFTGLASLVAFVLAAALVKENFARPAARGAEAGAREPVARGAEVAVAPGTAPAGAPGPRRAPNLIDGIISLVRSPDLAPMFVVLLLTTLAIGGIAPVLAIYVGQLHVAEAAVPTMAGLVFSVAGLGEGIAAPVMGRSADRVGYRRILLLCLAGAAAVYIPHALVRTAWQLVALRFVLGLFTGGIMPTATALVGRLAPAGRQSAAYGLTYSATSLGNFFGPLLGGGVASLFGIRAVFVTTASLIALNALWVTAKVRGLNGNGAAAGYASGRR